MKTGLHTRFRALRKRCFRQAALACTCGIFSLWVSPQVQAKPAPTLHINPAVIPVKGRITDDKGVPLFNVVIQVKNTNKGTLTDANGLFSIEVPDTKSVLVFSYIGYEKQEIVLGNRTALSITMLTNAGQLNDVVVVGYGTAKKATLTGAVSAIKGVELIKTPTTNVSNSLVGRIPGLTATTPSGEPGADDATLRIRGTSSLYVSPTSASTSGAPPTNSNDALLVVDGVASPDRSLARMDPNSIESVTVLKDASAAIYGSEAANGVILVTTKRGRLGKPLVNVNYDYGYNQPSRTPKMADAATYATMINEINTYAGVALTYTPDDIKKFQDGSDPWGHPNTDWFKAVLKPRSAQSAANINISGGSETMHYYVSVGTKKQDGFYYHSGTKYQQYDFRSNLDGNITKNISIAFDVAGRLEDRNYPTRAAGDIFRMIMRGKPNMPAYWPDGTPGPDIEYGNNPAVISTDATGYNRDKRYFVNSNFKVNVNIPWVAGLSITGNAAIDKGFLFDKLWQTPWYLYTWPNNEKDANGKPILLKGKRGFDNAQLTESFEDNQHITLNALANYERIFAKFHTIKILVGTESRKGYGDKFNAFRKYFASTSLDELVAGGEQDKDNNGSAYSSARLNYFGRVNYNYKEKYLVEFVWREDGSYIFPELKRYGFFPGVSAGWRLSEEDFWKRSVHFIDNFKLRGSWGQTGNDRIDEWQYETTYKFDGQPYGYGKQPFITNNGTVENKTIYETRVPNPNVTWEIANQADVGFDATLFQGRVAIVADYFDYTRSQVLWQRNASIPTSAGITPPRENIGKISNKGYDFSITYNNTAGDLHYQLGVNGGYQRNKILFWDEAPGAPVYQRTTGYSIPTDPSIPNNNLYYQAIGIFKDQDQVNKTPHWDGARAGDVIFADVNKDGKIDGNDRMRNDRTNLPRFTAGFSVGLQYKGFDLSILLQAATGAVNYISTESGEIGNYLQSFAANRWTPEHTDGSTPRTFNRSNEYWVGQRNTYWLSKTDYLRLKNVQLGYNLPAKADHILGIQNLRIYVSGFNLATYSPKYKDFDPEASAGSGQSYPLQRIVNGGLSLTF